MEVNLNSFGQLCVSQAGRKWKFADRSKIKHKLKNIDLICLIQEYTMGCISLVSHENARRHWQKPSLDQPRYRILRWGDVSMCCSQRLGWAQAPRSHSHLNAETGTQLTLSFVLISTPSAPASPSTESERKISLLGIFWCLSELTAWSLYLLCFCVRPPCKNIQNF